MKCVNAGQIPVLLAKKNGNIFALANTCSHLGGPLAEGDLLDDCVRCPWHGSVFSLKDGSVVNGPATEPQPEFDVRINNGWIEIKLSGNGNR
jgi:nitrite reductase/ring-hydroxylating ferredoxin subunit